MAFTEIILNDQDCFAEEEDWETLLQLIPDSETENLLRARWKVKALSSNAKWEAVKKEAKKNLVRP